jgi:hypothetical protein
MSLAGKDGKLDSKSQIVSVELRLRSIRGKEKEIDGLKVKIL